MPIGAKSEVVILTPVFRNLNQTFDPLRFEVKFKPSNNLAMCGFPTVYWADYLRPLLKERKEKMLCLNSK